MKINEIYSRYNYSQLSENSNSPLKMTSNLFYKEGTTPSSLFPLLPLMSL